MLISRALICLTLLLSFAAGTPAQTVAPSAESVQSELDGLSARKLPEAESSALRQTLEQTLILLENQQTQLQALNALQAQLRQAPEQTQAAQQALQQLKNQPLSDSHEDLNTLSSLQLERRLNRRNLQLADYQSELSEANSLIISAQSRPERAQDEISQNQVRLQVISNQLASGRDGARSLTPEGRNKLLAEQQELEARNQLRRAELSGNNLLLDLGNARKALLEEQINRTEHELLALQSVINEQRRARSEQTQAELALNAEKIGSDQLLSQASQNNLDLSSELLHYTEQLNSVTEANLRVRRQLDAVGQSERILQEQVNALQDHQLLARVLYQQQKNLPKALDNSNLPNQIADLRLYQFELNQQRERLTNPEQYVTQLLAEHPDSHITPDERSTLLELTQTRSELLERLNQELNTLLSESINLQLSQDQLNNQASQLKSRIEQQLFWIPSNSPLNWQWLRQVPQRLQQQLAELPVKSSLQNLYAGLSERPWVFLPVLIVAVILLARRKTLLERLEALHQQVGHYKRDSHLTTLLAILIVLLLTLPGSLLLSLCGYALSSDTRGQNLSLSAAFYAMSVTWLLFYSAYRALSKDGIATRHLGWPAEQVAFLQRNIAYLGLAIMALSAVVAIAERQPLTLSHDVLGILCLITGYILISALLLRIIFKGPRSRLQASVRQGVGILFAMVPVVLVIAVGFGYYYTALKLTSRLIDTLYLMLIWVLLDALLRRSLDLAARRLAYQRALASRAQTSPETGDSEVFEQPSLDIGEVNQQSSRLLRLALLGSFLFALYFVWADLISVFTYLDSVTLYQYTNSIGELTAITIGSLLGAMLLASLAVVLARNLPGLLEVLVLSRLQLSPSSIYATTTLLSYAIIALGVVLTLSTLGVTWDKLQWLVAALSVGIGFGMQAIFANFISGLILLFERPIRIGDMITIGAVSGTVRRIHIRATHIIDSDRKAVIVPNQTFLTSQLINWTLTDTITRVVLTFTVNRGADLDQVRELMLQAARENARVMRDPGPSVQLRAYGAASLEHDLRVYVRELGDRGPVLDELNRRVDELFVAHGINTISATKLEVTLQNNQGQERTLSTHPIAPHPED